MVRVISVHNFPRQNVSVCEDVITAVVANPDILLLAQRNHNIIIRCEGCADRHLSTVDEPVSVQFSARGNYIATLETRGDIKFVRVYLGWEVADGTTPLRARIAGMVSPLSQQAQGVEMLEVPTPAMPQYLAVCPFSGNLLVSSEDKLSVFKYIVQQHDISRVEFPDLFQTKWSLHLSFVPTQIRMCEDIIAAHNDQCLVVLRVSNIAIDVKEDRKVKCERKSCGPIDYDLLIESPSSYSVDFRTHLFPSVAAEPQIINTPFSSYHGFPPKLIYHSPAKGDSVNVKTLLQLHIPDQSSSRREVNDVFACIRLTPYYNNESQSRQRAASELGGPRFHELSSVACFFGTQQEGYLYHYMRHTQKCNLSSVYTFTALLHDVVLENALLHALTDAGLETYTLRVPESQTPTISALQQIDTICLVGLRPFLYVRQLVLGSRSLYLLASQDPSTSSPWTIYQLSLSEPAALWADFLSVAEENRWESPSTYAHLVREANAILRTRRDCLRSITNDKSTNEEAFFLVDSLYKQSCYILADYYILCEGVETASQMYELSELRLTDVVKRVQSLYETIPAKYRNDYDETGLNARLIMHVKHALAQEDARYNRFADNREEFYSPHVSGLVAVVLDVLENDERDKLSLTILSSPVIQQFGCDRSLHVLETLADPQPADSLALSILYLQKGKSERSHTLLASLDHSSLEPLLLQHPHLLFEPQNSASELTLALLDLNPGFLTIVLSACLENSTISYDTVQFMLTQLLQTAGLQSKNSADVLESVIEDQISIWLSKRHLAQHTLRDAVNTLTCLYLSRLSQRREIEAEIELLRDCRPKYLDQMPPFAPDFSHILSPQHSPTHSDVQPKNVLMKLQCLLGSEIAKESVYRVRVLLSKTPKVFGSLSIQVQCAAPAEAAQMLINFAPHALLAYLKEMDLDELLWRNVIEQLQYKVSSASDPKRKFYYKQIQGNVLEHIAQRVSLQSLADLLPMEFPDRNQYLRLAYNHDQAQQIRSLIMITGSQLI